MRLNQLVGVRLAWIKIGQYIWLEFWSETACNSILIEVEFVVSRPDTSVRVTNEAVQLAPLLELYDQQVLEASADEDSGQLAIDFTNGVRITVDPDQHVEAWSFLFERGGRIVCTPGGELVIWDSDPGESAEQP